MRARRVPLHRGPGARVTRLRRRRRRRQLEDRPRDRDRRRRAAARGRAAAAARPTTSAWPADDRGARGASRRGRCARPGIAPTAPADVGAFMLAGVDLEGDEEGVRAALQARGLARRVVVGNDTFAVLRAGAGERLGHRHHLRRRASTASASAPGGAAVRYPALGEITGDWGGGGDLGRAALGAPRRARPTAAARARRWSARCRPRSVSPTRSRWRRRSTRAGSRDERLVELAPVVDRGGRRRRRRGRAPRPAGRRDRRVRPRHGATAARERRGGGRGARRRPPPGAQRAPARRRAASGSPRSIRRCAPVVPDDPPIVGAALIALETAGGDRRRRRAAARRLRRPQDAGIAAAGGRRELRRPARPARPQ